MRIAIPTFGTRVSPRFDCAQVILLVVVDDGRLSERRELVACDWAPHERINKLLELGVNTVICGSIDCWSAESLQSVGITIYGWVTGEVEEVLAVLLRGEMDFEVTMEAGGRRGYRRFPGREGTRGQSPGPVWGMKRGGGRRRGRQGGRGGGGR